jgi:hypothetical protein
MEELRVMMKNEYLINVKIDADVIYYLIDRIYYLEKKIKNLDWIENKNCYFYNHYYNYKAN